MAPTLTQPSPGLLAIGMSSQAMMSPTPASLFPRTDLARRAARKGKYSARWSRVLGETNVLEAPSSNKLNRRKFWSKRSHKADGGVSAVQKTPRLAISAPTLPVIVDRAASRLVTQVSKPLNYSKLGTIREALESHPQGVIKVDSASPEKWGDRDSQQSSLQSHSIVGDWELSTAIWNRALGW
jgi:hypothetical protein